jgi:shikimate dehydrogenase
MSDQYAVIGNPISHTKSPLIHGTFARTTGQELEYTAIEASVESFARTVLAFRDNGGRGMNVTAPFKLQAFDMSDERSARAQQAGAVNALKFEAGRILADNFDGVGLLQDIRRNLGIEVTGKRILVLGAGGAARGAIPQFLAQRPSELIIVNRTVAKAQELAAQYSAENPVHAVGYADVDRQPFHIVINATSASLRGELPPISQPVFAQAHLAYELAYGKGLTPFLRLAQAEGVARLADGVGMLVEQAAEAFAWWRGIRPDTRGMIDSLTIPLR